MPGGQVLTADRYEPLFGELLTEKHPTRTVEVRGQQVPVGTYELCWSALELYSPMSAEQLAVARGRCGLPDYGAGGGATSHSRTVPSL
jgi:hypothetical protein